MWSKQNIQYLFSNTCLLDVFYADTAFYLPVGEILRCVLVDQVANQITRIYEQPDKLSSITSYMSYCVHLELVGKSPYSATVNDAIHNWVHILRALRSITLGRRGLNQSRPSLPAATFFKFTFVRCKHPQLEKKEKEKSNSLALVFNYMFK